MGVARMEFQPAMTANLLSLSLLRESFPSLLLKVARLGLP
jgi:hypothetical protein